MADRTCSICGLDKPLDKEHYRYRVKDGKGHYTAECLECIKREKRKSALRVKRQRKQSLKKIESESVDLFIKQSAGGGSNVPHSAELLERVFQYFGGVGGFSSVLVKQYWDSPAGGSARNRILETLCRLVVKNVETGGAKKPLQLWSEEELEAELDRRFEQAVVSMKGKTIDVSAEAITEEASAGLGSLLALPGADDRVREELPQGTPERVAGEEARSVEALPSEPEPGEGSRLHGE